MPAASLAALALRLLLLLRASLEALLPLGEEWNRSLNVPEILREGWFVYETRDISEKLSCLT